ncbi:MAG: hypothetical protein SFV15_15075 [Polyangiaceae bacterium]|nr:hypothetical protein [Polyangiaceae bacterium]
MIQSNDKRGSIQGWGSIFARFAAGVLALGLGQACANAALPTPVAMSDVHARPSKLCPGGSVTTPRELARYQGCTEISGDLNLQGPSLTSLSPLNKLRRVDGNLVVSRTSAVNLAQLAELESVHALVVTQNPELVGLGSSHLAHASAVLLMDNPKLRSLESLERLHTLDSLVLSGSDVAYTTAFKALSVVGNLILRDNPHLISLGGFSNLVEVSYVEIVHNPALSGVWGILPAADLRNAEVEVRDNRGLLEREVLGLLEASNAKRPQVSGGWRGRPGRDL